MHSPNTIERGVRSSAARAWSSDPSAPPAGVPPRPKTSPAPREHAASMFHALRDAARFGVSILASDQEALSRRFAAMESSHRFEGIGYVRGESGVVLLTDALAHLECRLLAQQEAGDHSIFIGEVEGATARNARPLLYYRGGYAQLER